MEKDTIRAVRPVAVVALGDPVLGDDGVALRVMGRVRPLLGEIALTGKQVPLAKRPMPPRGGIRFYSEEDRPSWLQVATRTESGALNPKRSVHALGSIVDWIEGVSSSDLLREALSGRMRVVIIDAVSHDASPGHVQHWHLEKRTKTNLSLVRFYHPVPEESFDHLPFWLEDEIPEHGTDLIAIQPYRVEPSADLSSVLRSRLASITAQVGGLLLRILEEEGWRFGTARRRPRQRRRRTG